VTFIVPCYRLARLLGECVRSILDQTWQDFEVLILDDCSPDDTPAVAATFTDPRVRYVRNPRNLGHLGNYNKGLHLARGRYIWLISADDALASPTVLEGHVRALEDNHGAAFVFAPGVMCRDGANVGTYGPGWTADRLLSGREFLRLTAGGNMVCAPTALARRSAYRDIGFFPQDLPYAGDWYVWSAFALTGDVVYRADPAARYRVHELSMTTQFYQNASRRIADELEVRWRIRRETTRRGMRRAARAWTVALAHDYAIRIRRKETEDWPFGLTPAQVAGSINAHLPAPGERRRMLGLVHEQLGELSYARGDFDAAAAAYRQAVASRGPSPRAWAKLLLARSGRTGRTAREWIERLRRGALRPTAPSSGGASRAPAA
jgi:glycosyltransferase involved in cell wall biosynthesis